MNQGKNQLASIRFNLGLLKTFRLNWHISLSICGCQKLGPIRAYVLFVAFICRATSVIKNGELVLQFEKRFIRINDFLG